MDNNNGEHETVEAIRARIEEKKRVTLTEGRMLLDRLEGAAAEIARLQEAVAQSDHSASPPPPEQQATETLDVPEAIRVLLAQAEAQAGDPNSAAGAIYQWCNRWVAIRSKLATLLEAEDGLNAEIEQLNQDAGHLLTRFSS